MPLCFIYSKSLKSGRNFLTLRAVCNPSTEAKIWKHGQFDQFGPCFVLINVHTLTPVLHNHTVVFWWPMGSSTGSSWRSEAPWTADRGQNGTHSLSFASFSQIPPQLWGAFRCQLEGFSPLGWDRKRSLTKKPKKTGQFVTAGDRCLATVKPPVKPNYPC